MTTLEIWLLAISLAMDCFTVSITSGIIMRRICWRTFFIMAFFFGLFQAVMPLIGWFAASRFSHRLDIVENANDLRVDTVYQLHGGRIEADLPGKINGIANAHGLRIGADGSRGVRDGDDGLGHGKLPV